MRERGGVMQCSLYGKLPAKRDFIAIGVPRDFLNAWEPWLQGGVSASRTKLGERWQPAFLTAPIWRFWLGAEVCGRSVIGAFMSSLDGVGRYFPLTLFAWADDDAAIPPPELDTQDAWFESAEAFLISTLDQNIGFDAITAALGDLVAPSQTFPKPPASDSMTSGGKPIVMRAGEEQFALSFRSIRELDHAKIYAAATFWWTIGGEDFAPAAFCCRRLPDPYLFAAMLTGEFADDRT
jgi:type VI secretion system protein ImpM